MSEPQTETVEENETTVVDVPDEDTTETRPGDVPKPSDDEPIPSGETEEEDEREDDADDEDSGVDTDLVIRAVEAGMSVSEAASFKDSESLMRVVDVLERRAGASGRSDEAETPKPKADGPKPEDVMYKLELDDGEYDADVVKAVRGMNEHYAKQAATAAGEIEQMKAVLGNINQAIQAEQDRRFVDWYHGKVAALGDEWQDVFGDVSKGQPKPGTKAYRANEAMIRFMDEHAPKRAELWDAGTNDRLFDMALFALHKDKYDKKIRQKIGKSVKKRRGTVTTPPTHKDASDATGEGERAVRLIKQMARERGIDMPD